MVKETSTNPAPTRKKIRTFMKLNDIRPRSHHAPRFGLAQGRRHFSFLPQARARGLKPASLELQLIPEPVHRHDVSWGRRIALDLLSQLDHKVVDGPGRREGLGPPDGVQDL